MWIADNWKDYELIDASNGERLERWGQHILVRPDPVGSLLCTKLDFWKEFLNPIWNGSMYFLWTMYCSGLPIRYS